MRKTYYLQRILIILLFTLTISGCIFPGVYRIDIPQGNLVDNEKLSQVQVGMEPRQVRYLLGTPLITDTFNQNRWDYFYSVTNGDKSKVDHHVTILFSQGKVTEINDNLKTTN